MKKGSELLQEEMKQSVRHYEDSNTFLFGIDRRDRVIIAHLERNRVHESK